MTTYGTCIRCKFELERERASESERERERALTLARRVEGHSLNLLQQHRIRRGHLLLLLRIDPNVLRRGD